MKKLSIIMALLLCMSFLIIPVGAEEKGFVPDTELKLTADAIYLLDLDNNEVIYEKNADDIIYPASITKVLAAIVAIEETPNLDTEIITYPMSIQNEIYEYVTKVGGISIGHLLAGEEMTMREYLYAMLLPSANEAAMAVAEHVGGSQEGFADMMNARAKELGATDTHFTNPTGLFEEDHTTTARDLAKIVEHALTLPDFVEIMSTYRYTVSTNMHDSLTWESTIKMQDPDNSELYYPYLKGVKTGTVPESGYSFASTASKDGFNYMLIVIGAEIGLDENGRMISETNRAFLETKAIYDWAFESLKTKTLIEQNTPIGEVPVNLSWDQNFVQVAAKDNISTRIPDNLAIEGEGSVIQTKKELPEYLDAPVEKGEEVGELIVYAFGEEIARTPLITTSKVESSAILKIWSTLKKLGESFWFKFVLIFLALLLVFYIVLLILRNRNKKRRRGIYRNKR